MLTCEQFEHRIQGLMDQRQELTGDPLLDSHSSSCSSCKALLESYRSLDDSFSGKLPIELTMTQVSQPTASAPSGFRYWPIAVTLGLGILIGVFVAPMMNQNRGTPETPGETATMEDEADLDPDGNLLFVGGTNSETSQDLGLDLTYLAFDQLRRQYPTIEMYLQYTAGLPGISSLNDSMNITIAWLQNAWNPPEATAQSDPEDIGTIMYVSKIRG